MLYAEEDFLNVARPMIHIAVISDEGYAYPTTVMLASVKHNKKKESKYCVHCISNGMTSFSKNQIKALAEDDFEVLLYEIEDKEKYNSIDIVLGGTWSISTIIKTDIPEILNGLEKVLFLDGDILVTKDLTDLWEIDIQDDLLAAVPGLAQERAKIYNIETYFNAGVLLMNLKKWREDCISEKVWEQFRDDPSQYPLCEQDVFNKVCRGRVRYLPYIWNCFAVAGRLERTLQYVNELYQTQLGSWEEMEANAAVFHYVWYKPWRDRCLPHASLWQKYHDISPYGNTALIYPPPPTPSRSYNLKVKLFGFIPLLSVKNRERSCSIRIIGIELFRVRKNNRKRVLSFLYIPVATWRV